MKQKTMFVLALAVAAACKSSQPEAKQPLPPPANGSALAGAERCRQAIARMDELVAAVPVATSDDPPPPPGETEPAPAAGSPPSPAAQAARKQAIQEARKAGILADETPDCIARWSNAVVDCVLAAKSAVAASACAPPAPK